MAHPVEQDNYHAQAFWLSQQVRSFRGVFCLEWSDAEELLAAGFAAEGGHPERPPHGREQPGDVLRGDPL